MVLWLSWHERCSSAGSHEQYQPEPIGAEAAPAALSRTTPGARSEPGDDPGNARSAAARAGRTPTTPRSAQAL